MGQVLQFPRQNAFYPETVNVMGQAYDEAIANLNQEGAASELFVRELVAKRIIKMARRGEADRERLCKSAISGFAKSRHRA
jgi:hypothetical protein